MDYRDIERAALAQGWRFEVKKSGVMWYSPDKVHTAMWHNTPSDHRALANFLSKMRQGGLVYPPPRNP